MRPVVALLMKLAIVCVLNLLLLASPRVLLAAEDETPADRKVKATLVADLGPDLRIKRLEVRQRAAGVYHVDMDVSLAGYADATRRKIRGLVRSIAEQSLGGLGYELDPDSRFKFYEGPDQVAEVRGERPITVVMFMPGSTQPRTLRLSPAAVRALGRGDLTPAGTEIADLLGVPESSTEILVNTRQVYLRWRTAAKESGEGATAGAPTVVYARWWGKPPAPPPATDTHREKRNPFKPWWLGAQFWHAQADAAVSSGATGAGRARTSTNGRLAPEVVVGAGDAWFAYQKMEHTGTLDAAFVFAGAPFAAGATLDFELERLELAAKHRWYEHGENRIEAMGGLQMYLPRARISTPTRIGILDGYAAGPVLGVLGKMRCSRRIDLAGGLKLPLAVLGKSEVTGWEGEAAAVYKFPNGFEGKEAQLSLGYRLLELEVLRGDGNQSARAGAVEPDYGGFFLDFRTVW
ncbi:MAG: hypothetical protein HYY25_05740 [Candidatus Wallbacteria bacterium]|nr:hypothetical protein [Candidatus Wallbacteria bacterium]